MHVEYFHSATIASLKTTHAISSKYSLNEFPALVNDFSEQTRLDAFEMKELTKILRVSWTAKKTNVNKAGLKSELLDTVKAKTLAYYGQFLVTP